MVTQVVFEIRLLPGSASMIEDALASGVGSRMLAPLLFTYCPSRNEPCQVSTARRKVRTGQQPQPASQPGAAQRQQEHGASRLIMLVSVTRCAGAALLGRADDVPCALRVAIR